MNGSQQVFSAMIQEAISRNKVAIVRFSPRQNVQTRFCALVPQLESYDENHFQTPPGFHLVFLPYTDDLRSLSSVSQAPSKQLSNQLVGASKVLVNALTLSKFDFKNFEDPGLQSFFA